ncbi:MAG: hypothetical protein ACKO7Z_01830, partial [Cyanobacteriota bacterium]
MTTPGPLLATLLQEVPAEAPRVEGGTPSSALTELRPDDTRCGVLAPRQREASEWDGGASSRWGQPASWISGSGEIQQRVRQGFQLL